VPDRDYIDLFQRTIHLPDLLTGSEFLKGLSAPSGYKAAVDLIDHQNASLPTDRKWIVLPFESGFIKSADQATYGRLLVFVPGSPDLWINFAIATPEMASEGIVSVSVVAARPGSTDLLDFMREKNGDIYRLVPMSKHNADPSDNCYDCHKAAVMPIRPKREFVFDTAGKMVERTDGAGTIPALLNSKIRAYGQPANSAQDLGAFGPCLAPSGLVRSDEFIRTASGMPVTAESVSRIREAMNCASCHDSFARTNFPQPVHTSRDAKALRGHEPLVETYVEQGWMPPDNKLSPRERRALWLCLTKEYLDPAAKTGVFVDWLKGR
jgi:hypothetical protein